MKVIYSILFFSFCAIGASHAQSPVPEPDTVKNQIRQTDPVPQNVPQENYASDRLKITSAELPEEVKKTLSAGSEYTGWEKGSAYKTKDGKTFIVEMSAADTIRTFRFDKTGRLILD
jgi:hypothetical protein